MVVIALGTIYAFALPALLEPLRGSSDVVRWLTAHQEAALVEVAGHTDDQGGVAYNQGLSERRARAIEAPSLAVAADPLGCTRDERGRCVAVDACIDRPEDDDCLAPTEERAWSSPIFVEWGGEVRDRSSPGGAG